MSYKNIRIYTLSQELAIRVHKMTLELPAFEKYETGAQIRHSSKSVTSNIVEGFGRRRYKKEFIKFIIYAQASNDEPLSHLDTLYKTESLNDFEQYQTLRNDSIKLGKGINRFIKALETKHNVR